MNSVRPAFPICEFYSQNSVFFLIDVFPYNVNKMTCWHDDMLACWHGDKLTWWQTSYFKIITFYILNLFQIWNFAQGLTHSLTWVKTRDATASKKYLICFLPPLSNFPGPSVPMHSKIKTLNARNRGPNYELNRVKKYYNEFRGALKIHFRKKLGIWPRPKFLLKFSKNKFALVNGQKCDETHNT